MITKFRAQDFTAFSDLQLQFSPGVNILIGENGTGKTHVMKAIYAACCVVYKRDDRTFGQKIKSVFQPLSIGRLVHRHVGRGLGKVSVYRLNDNNKECWISCTITTVGKVEVANSGWREDAKLEAIFIPVKDMLANAPGFRALYAQKELSYEEVYADIIDKAFLPISRGKQDTKVTHLLNILKEAISGRVVEKKENFYLKNKSGELEFPLLAEGFRKLGLLYTLIHNGTLTKGSILFWDEPEANLNPKLAKTVVRILLELQRQGVQIFISTHDYVLLKEFQMAANAENNLLYISLYRDTSGEIRSFSTSQFDEIEHNAIDEAYTDILDREINNQFKGL